MTVIVLYTSTILTSIYLMCCISLLHGAVQYKREYVVPWICAACVAAVLLIAACVAADNYPTLINFFNGHTVYREYLHWLLIVPYTSIAAAFFARLITTT